MTAARLAIRRVGGRLLHQTPSMTVAPFPPTPIATATSSRFSPAASEHITIIRTKNPLAVSVADSKQAAVPQSLPIDYPLSVVDDLVVLCQPGSTGNDEKPEVSDARERKASGSEHVKLEEEVMPAEMEQAFDQLEYTLGVFNVLLQHAARERADGCGRGPLSTQGTEEQQRMDDVDDCKQMHLCLSRRYNPLPQGDEGLQIVRTIHEWEMCRKKRPRVSTALADELLIHVSGRLLGLYF